MKARWIRVTLAGFVAVSSFALAGCDDSADPKSADGSTLSGTVTVSAAASLTESFTEIGKDFEAAHPGVEVTLNFGGSSTLAAQINQGAPVDVFASASPASMKAVTDAGNGQGEATTFVKNQLVIAVPKGNPRGIKTLADLARNPG